MNNEEYNLIQYIQIVRKHLIAILLIIVFTSSGGVIYAICQPDIYLASATFMPLGADNKFSLSSLAGQFGSFMPSSSLLGGLGVSGPNAKIEVLIKSRTLTERFIRRLDLTKFYFKELWDDKTQKWRVNNPKDEPSIRASVGIFQSRLTINSNITSGTVDISYEDEDPELVANVVNTVLSELQEYLSEEGLTNSRRYRKYIESQLIEIKKECLESGKNLAEFYRNHDISSVSSVVDVPIGTGGTPSELANAPISMEDLNQQIDALQSKKETISERLNEVQTVKKVPQHVYLEYLEQQKVLLLTLNSMISQQYEMAKMQEVKEEISFQVIDSAIVPTGKYKPKRKQIVVVFFLMGILFGLLYSFSIDFFKKMWLQFIKTNNHN